MIKVLGYGDNVFDDYFQQKVMYPGGNALNFSVYTHELGANSAYLGNIAYDELGAYIISVCKQMNIDISKCNLVSNHSTQICRILLNGNDRIFCEDKKVNNQVPFIQYEISLKEYMSSFDLIHMGCYCKVEKDIPMFQFKDTLISYDFSNETENLEKTFYENICPYLDFASFSSDYDEETTKRIMESMFQCGCKNVLATRSTKGQIFYNGSYYYGSCKQVNAIDTCGAGDSFISAFLISILESGFKKGDILKEAQIVQALEKARDFSAENCMRSGSFGMGKKYD